MGFPKHNIDPRGKNKKWVSQFIKAAWDEFKEISPNNFFNGRSDFNEIKMYMSAQQPIDKYKKKLLPSEDLNEDTSWLRINWDILPIVPKYRRIAIDLIKKQRYFINVFAADALAMDDQEKYYSKIKAAIELRDELQAQGIDPSIVGLGSDMPQDLAELEMHMKYSYKHRAAVEVETAIDLIFQRNRYSDIRDVVIEDIFDYGVSCVREFVDYDGEIKTERVSPEDMVVSYTEDPYFSDLHYAGQVREYTLGEIENMLTDSERKSKEWADLKESMNPGGGNQYKGRRREDKTHSNKVEVLHLEFMSSDTVTFEERTSKDGKVFFGLRSNGDKNKEYTEGTYDMVYSGYWILDSDFYFGCGKETNIKRDPDSLKNTSLNYHVVAPEMYRMSAASVGRQVIPIADAIQQAWYKLQNVIARAKPAGIAIEATSLQSVPFGGMELKPQDIVNMYNFSGNLVYRRVDDTGEVANWRPIDELNNGIGEDAQRYFQLIQGYIQMIRDITGLNEITDASSPDPKMLKSVAQLATVSTNNSLRYIHEAEKKLTDRVASDIMIRIQDAAQDGTIEGYRKALGVNTIEYFTVDPDVSMRSLGIFFEEEPSQEDKDALREKLSLALQPTGDQPAQITIDDMVFIESIRNPKMAAEWLGYRVRKNREEAEARAMRLQEANAQVQIQSAQAAAQMEQQTQDKKYDREERLETIKGEYAVRVAQINQEGRFQDELVKGDTRIKEAKIQTESKEYTEEMKALVNKESKKEDNN